MRIRLIYPKFIKFLEGHEALREIVKEHLVGDYTMPPSLAIPTIAALTPDDIEVNLTDDNIGQRIDYDEKVDIVAITCFTPQAQRAYEIADEFLKRGTKVILGGIHPTGAPAEAKTHATSVCIGEVEPIWGDIIKDLRSGTLKDFYKVSKPCHARELPIPKREIFPSGVYKWDAHMVITTRGCPVRCDMCPIPNKEGPLLSLRPVDNIIKDIESTTYREFYFTDDTVMLPGKKSRKFLLDIMERTKDIDVSIFLSSTMMMSSDPELYKILAAGGVSSMYTVFGFDRASKVLFSDECTKDDWQRAKDLVKMNEDAGIHFFASYGIGFDYQDKKHFDRMLQFSHEANVDLAEFYINTPFPGTPFGKRAEAEGRILHRNYNYWNTGNVVFKPNNFTADELLESFYYLWKSFYENKSPNKTLRSFDINEDSESKKNNL